VFQGPFEEMKLPIIYDRSEALLLFEQPSNLTRSQPPFRRDNLWRRAAQFVHYPA
jgi:hypothetical protein